jgi:hypothetical protein
MHAKFEEPVKKLTLNLKNFSRIAKIVYPKIKPGDIITRFNLALEVYGPIKVTEGTFKNCVRHFNRNVEKVAGKKRKTYMVDCNRKVHMQCLKVFISKVNEPAPCVFCKRTL